MSDLVEVPKNPAETVMIIPKLQKTNYDCGQTCLDMLGYDGNKMFPGVEVSSSDLRSIPGAKDLTLPVGQEETLDYSYPHIWILLGKDKVAGAQHWVIRHGDKIYCPTVGVMDSKEYKNRYVAFILQIFVVPFKGQEVPYRYYKNHQSSIDNSNPENLNVKKSTTPNDNKLPNPEVGKDYTLFGRKVRFIDTRTLPNGINQFQVEYLDDRGEKSDIQEAKKGDKEWHGHWRLDRLVNIDS